MHWFTLLPLFAMTCPFSLTRSLTSVLLLSGTKNFLADAVRLRQISERIPAGRWGQPVDFAGPVVFLASSASQYVCGELLVVDGVSHLAILLGVQ